MSVPTSFRGHLDDNSLDVSAFAGVIDLLLENIPALTWPESVRTYAQMRHYPQIASSLRAYKLAINRAHWAIDGEGCRDEVTARVADDLGLPIKGADKAPTGARRRGFTFNEHRRLALSLTLDFGHAPFEQAYEQIGGMQRLVAVQERMPQSIKAIRLNQDGTLRGAEQNAITGRDTAPLLTTADHRLVWYTREREGSNYFGQSLIREAYSPWLLAVEMWRVHGTSIRRFGMGVPTVEAPIGATPAQIAEAQRLASSMRAGASSGAGLPPGFIYKLTGLTGSAPDTLAFIQYLDRMMTRSMLTSILDMATSDNGARALGQTVMQLLTWAQQAEGDRIAADSTTQLVIPLVDANFGTDELCPIIVCGDVAADPELSAAEMAGLLAAGGLSADDKLRVSNHQRYGLPAPDPATRTGATTTDGGVNA